MWEDGPQLKNSAHSACREFLDGSWADISSEEMIFREVRGGLCNRLYYCALPESKRAKNGEQKHVLLRLYGQQNENREEQVISESAIFMLLSERGLGPALHGVFSAGRLEEYIPSRCLVSKELEKLEISTEIAKQLAKIHSLQVPIRKQPTWLFTQMRIWLDFLFRNIRLNRLQPAQKSIAVNVLSAQLVNEVDWLRSLVGKTDSPVVFCHNDVHPGNILLPEESNHGRDGNLVIIDFEQCSYNYRGFDIANHFCEWSFDYTHADAPYFTADLNKFPSETQQLQFIETYLQELNKDRVPDDSPNTADHILSEVRIFILASHMLWGVWSFYMAITSNINFGYWEYGKTRLDAYNLHKESVLRSKQWYTNAAENGVTDEGVKC